MKQLIWIALLGMLTFGSAVLAQEAESWPPDPNAIFAEGVQWTPFIYGIPDGPVKADHERSVIRVLDSETGLWREYPYPVTDRSLNVWMLPNGLVAVKVYKESNDEPLPGELFFLNPDTGVYTEPPTVCEGKVIQAEAGEGKWVAAHHDKAETQAFLCHSATGEQREALPQDLSVWRIYPNPSGTQLVAIGQEYRESEFFELYAYNLETNTIISLGEMNHPLEIYVSVCDWFNDTTALLCSSGMQSWLWVRRIAFDITQENGINDNDTLSGYGWGEDTIRLDDPVRYISASVAQYNGAKAGTQAGDYPCTVSVYDASGAREHELGTGCTPILLDSNTIAPFYRQGDSLYFLARDRFVPEFSSLTRFDMEQETTTQIGPYAAEIENIISVSPDGRYIVVLTDDNNVLDFPWPNYRGGCCQQQYGWFVTIIDAEANAVVYLSERLGVYHSKDVKWLDNETVVISSAEIYKESGGFMFAPPATLRMIRLGDIITTQSVTMVVDIAAPKHYAVHGDNTVIDLFTFEPVSIVQEGILETYDVGTYSDEETGDLIVSVSADDDGPSTYYRVVLPEQTETVESAR